MLEGLAAWILRTYVGEYVENLNTDQLSIGVGTVDLHNLPLKKTALRGLDLPLEVKSGFIGHLQLSIPLTRPKSEPWIININKLYLVAGPQQLDQYNEDEEKANVWNRKKKQLDLFEAQWKESQQKDQSAGGFWSYSWWPSLYSSFSTTIVENLQLCITDVHIRYENATLEKHAPFAFGITIAKLSAQSTNENWYSSILHSEANSEVPNMEVVTERLFHEENKLKERETVEKPYEKVMLGTKSKDRPKCHHCGKPGHLKRNCWSLKKEKEKEQQNKPESKPVKHKANVVAADSDSESLGLVTQALAASVCANDVWIIDSGATCHMTNDRSSLRDILELTEPVHVQLGDGKVLNATARGTVTLYTVLRGGNEKRCNLKDVLFVPKLSYSLLSVPKATGAGLKVSFDKSECKIVRADGATIAVGKKVGSLFHLKYRREVELSNAATAELSMSKEMLWHQRYGHLGTQNLKKLANESLVTGFDFDPKKGLDFCEACVQGKLHRCSFPTSGAKRATEPLGLAHSALCGKITPKSAGGAEYFMTLTDDKTRYVWVYALKKKDEAFKKFQDWKALVEKSSGYTLKILRSDNGGEYVSTDFDIFLKSEGVVHQTTVPKTPQQNGVAERLNRTLVESVRSMLVQAKLPQKFWVEALNTAVYLHNRSPTRSLEGLTPYEAWTGSKPDVSNLKCFGCTAYAHIPKDERKKLDPKARKCVFLGYGTDTKAYRLFDVERQRVIYSRDVKFDEGAFGILQKDKPDGTVIKLVDVELSNNDDVELSNNDDVELSNNDDVDEGPSVLRQSSRERRPPDRLGEWVTINSEESIQNERTIKYKLMDLQSLAVYWDNDVSLVGDLPSSDLDVSIAGDCLPYQYYTYIHSALQRMINRSDGTIGFCRHEYILEAISAQAKVQRNASVLPLKDKNPRFVVDVHIESIPFSLAEFQYRSLTKLIGEFERSFRQSHYRKWRPSVAIKNNAKLWWQFSINCILNIIQKRNKQQSWQFAISRVHDITVYVKAYTEHLTNKVLTAEMKESMERIEKDLTFEELVVIRRVAMNKAEKEFELLKYSCAGNGNQASIDPTVSSQGWLSGWYSWYWQDSSDGSTFTAPTTKEEEEFLDELSGPVENQSIFNRDRVFAHLNIHLGSGCFKLLTVRETKVDNTTQMTQSPVIELEFSNACWESEVRPQSSTWECKMSLGGIHVRDKLTKGSLFPELVAPQVKKAVKSQTPVTKASVGALAMSSTSFGLNIIQELSEPPVFEMKFVQLPPQSKVSYKFSLTTEPLDITYNPLVIESISDFFSKGSLNTHYMSVERQLKEAAWLRYEELKNQTKAELRHTLDSMMEGVEMKHFKRWDIQLEISAPRIFIPENFKDRKASVVLVDFGHLSFKNSEAIEREHQVSEGADTDIDDDSFVTPLSTPPSENEEDGGCSPNSAMKLAQGLTPDDIRHAMYDRLVETLHTEGLIPDDIRHAMYDRLVETLHTEGLIPDDIRHAMYDRLVETLHTEGLIPDDIRHAMYDRIVETLHTEGLIPDDIRHAMYDRLVETLHTEGLIPDDIRDTMCDRLVETLHTEGLIPDDIRHAMYDRLVETLHTESLIPDDIRHAMYDRLVETLHTEGLIPDDIRHAMCDRLVETLHTEGLIPDDIRDTMYDRYMLVLSDIQMVVCPARDAGKEVGQTDMHVVDKFTISLSLDRRLMFTADPQYPALGLAGNLPCLVFHINEHKCHALSKCIKQLTGQNKRKPLHVNSSSGFVTSTPVRPHSIVSTSTEDLDQGAEELYYSMYSSQVTLDESPLHSRRSSKAYIESAVASKTKELMEESKLVLVQFTIDQLSCGVHSRGHLIAELQVYGVSLEYLQRPYDTSMSLKVHGLHLVDALQSYGPEYELLLSSSQRNWSTTNITPTKGNQDTLAILMQFFSSVFSSDKDSCEPFLPAIPEETVKNIPEQVSQIHIFVTSPCPPRIDLMHNDVMSSSSNLETLLDEKSVLRKVTFAPETPMNIQQKDDWDMTSDDDKTPIKANVHRLIKIDFNSLDTVVNLQTWVLVLDFFGIGVPQTSPSQPNSPVSTQAPSSVLDPVTPQTPKGMDLIYVEEEPTTTHIEIQVQSLTLTLNKSQYPLAKAKVAGLFCFLKMGDGRLCADGKLATVSLTDMSPHGSLYREKFTSCGDEALRFEYIKYDDPDLSLQRDNDMSLSLRMSSVQYVHTKRFITELIAFCQHFLQLQEVLGRMRAQSAGNEVSWMFGRSARVSLDIKAGSPVIVIPQSSKSPHMLVADLGDLTITNAFLWEESEGTIAYNPFRRATSLSGNVEQLQFWVVKSLLFADKSRDRCLLDCMVVDLQDMDLFTAVRVPPNVQQSTSKFTFTRQGVKLLKEKCRLNLQVERNLDWSLSKAVSDFLCSGELSSVYARLDYSQYCLILGLLGENFGEVLEEFETPSSYLQDPLGKPPEFEEVWTTLKMSINLVNVSLELLPVQLFEHPEQQPDEPLPSLARIDFIKSKFEFETFSDWSKTTDLVSTEVIFEDTRDMGEPCVFKDVLLPKCPPSDSTNHDENSLQFEVHYRDTCKKTFLTFLFNHSRIVLIMDYLLDTYNFIMCQMFKNDEPSNVDTPNADDNDLDCAMYSPPPGVVTKCEVQSPQDQHQKTFEMKVNISGTEFVLLENLGTLDTNAVVLKINLHSSLNMRISYNDYKLYLAIFESVTKQLNKAMKSETATSSQQEPMEHDFDETVVRRLVELGFYEEDCIRALKSSSGRLEASATWLLENATPVLNTASDKGSGWQFAGFEVRASTMCVCLIDDCGDTDVPLIEISIQTIDFASKYVNIPPEDKQIIMHAKQTLLYRGDVPWVKKDTSDDLFDVTMGAYDGAESCELVVVYMLSQLKSICGEAIGLYRDDGLAVFHDPPRLVECAKKKICSLFASNGLKITIEANKKVINYLDVTLDLNSGKHHPYMKPGNTPSYVHAKSNHPPNILKRIPESVNQRLSDISSDETAFNKAAPPYQAALDKSGYEHKLKFLPRDKRKKKSRARKRNITWFNPPIRYAYFYFWHDLQATGDGAAHCSLVVEYYNRNVSGWEPWIEPWSVYVIKYDVSNIVDTSLRCQLHWQQQHHTRSSPKRLLVKLDAPDRLDITVTSMLINMIKQTISSWTEDLYGTTTPNDARLCDSNDSLESPVHRPDSNNSTTSTGSGPHRKRAPFVPYAIKNNTGCVVVFRTISTTPSRVIITSTGLKLTQHDNDADKMSDWREVPAGCETPFEFSSREKMRHKASDIQPVRIVFKVTLEGGARKVVTVQSALSVKNKMDLPLEIKLQGHTSYQGKNKMDLPLEIKLQGHTSYQGKNKMDLPLEIKLQGHTSYQGKNKMDLPLEIKLQGHTSYQGSFTLPIIQPQHSLTVPLHAVTWKIYARPHGVGVGFSSEAIDWKGVTKAFTSSGYARECHAVGSASKFRFCTAVQREGYPEDDPMSDVLPTKKLKVAPQPAHCISVLAPLVLVNLLPCDLSYNVKKSELGGNIKAGRSVPLYSVDPEQNLDLSFRIEYFESCDNIRILKRSHLVERAISHVELRDTNGRPLVLNLLITAKPGGALRISIYCPYWMINNTGIPLVFKRESMSQEIGGQFDEHEMARSLTPLLFSFYDRDPPLRCQMRIGRSFHEGSGKPVWCSPFSLDNPREFNRVHARQANGRPDKVYDIGIDVRFGRGRYQLTKIVTFATRYQLENKTPHTMAYNQRHFVRDQGTRNPERTLTALPGALVLFHWARTDLDQLLCIRLNDVYHCQWSGGFRIDRDDSFHINMRSLDGCSLFVRVEIMLKGATFHVVLTDASQLPPPYRIDNLSEVPVKFFQSGTEDRLRTLLQPKQSVPYSWDEPTLPPELSLGVVDGASYSRYFLNILGSGERLYYYNPIYIVFTHTFSRLRENGKAVGRNVGEQR
ncbi:hypothetical protein QZH41_011519 [Actinostola sp. cb2023]|nr:hypothetical protein QZH41_011519 [Actinostola sp. cb2023]